MNTSINYDEGNSRMNHTDLNILVVLGAIILLALVVAMLLRVLLIMNESSTSNKHNVRVPIL